MRIGFLNVFLPKANPSEEERLRWHQVVGVGMMIAVLWSWWAMGLFGGGFAMAEDVDDIIKALEKEYARTEDVRRIESKLEDLSAEVSTMSSDLRLSMEMQLVANIRGLSAQLCDAETVEQRNLLRRVIDEYQAQHERLKGYRLTLNSTC